MGELVFDASSAFLEHFSSPLRSLLYQVFIAFQPLIFCRLSGHGKVRRSKDVDDEMLLINSIAWAYMGSY